MIVHVYSALNLLWILCNSAIVNSMQFCLYLFVRPFNTGVHRRAMGWIQSVWVGVTSACFPTTQLDITGELPSDPTRPVIIIANHQVDADWWYIWQAARHHESAGNIKIVLKEQLKFVPIIGWGMRLFEFLFLKRSIDHDAKHIKAYMDSLIDDDFPFWLVIFPEGTTIHTEYVTKSRAFAEKTNRPKFNHVVLPRTAGLQVILDAVEKVQPDIYDLTLAFPSYSGEIPTFDMGYDRKIDTQVPSMKSLLAGKKTGPISIHSRRFSYADAKKDLQGFLDTRWAEKDVRMAHFIKHKAFPVQKNEKRELVTLSSSVTSVFRLWFGVTISVLLLPFVVLSFFPLYTLWVVYCFVYSIYDRTTNFWWPYIFNLILERAAKTREGLKFRQ